MRATTNSNVISRLIMWYFLLRKRQQKIPAALVTNRNSTAGHPQPQHGCRCVEARAVMVVIFDIRVASRNTATKKWNRTQEGVKCIWKSRGLRGSETLFEVSGNSLDKSRGALKDSP